MMAFCSVRARSPHWPGGGRLPAAASNSAREPLRGGTGLTLATSNSVDALCAKAVATDNIEMRTPQTTRIVLLQREVSVLRRAVDVVDDENCSWHLLTL